MVFFFLIAITILSLGYTYMGMRIIAPAHLPSPWNYIAWTLIVIFLLMPPLTMYYQMKRVDGTLSHLLMWIGYISMGFFSFVFTVVVLRDFAGLLFVTAGKVFGVPSFTDIVVDTGRRLFLMRALSIGIVTLAAAMTGYGIWEARKSPAIVEVDVPLPNLPKEFEGFRIVQITDIHAGLTVGRRFIETVAAQVKALSPDVIVFTGDFADGSVENLQNVVAPLGELVAPHGKFFVTGNHEYYSGVVQWIGEAQRLGFTTLVNEHSTIERKGQRILLAGVTDVSGNRFSSAHTSSPTVALVSAPVCAVKILLAHQPRALYDAINHGFDLQISGHTHGGQFFPWNFAARLGQPCISGLHKIENTLIYVSKGTGYWGPPMRLGSRSEITLLRLTRSNAAVNAS